MASSQLAVAATETTVVVLTSYPQEMVSQFEAAFEKAYPQYRLEFLWKQSRDAMAYLHQQHEPVDVYWAPAARNFAMLAKDGAFRKLDVDRTGLPDAVAGFQISDPDGFYVADEIAGFGMVYNPTALQKLGLAVPSDWADLTQPAWRGHITFPVPSKVGYAPMLVDTLLQAYGWDAGWKMLREIGANADFANSGATFVTDDVESGRIAAGATIDFFAVSEIANGTPLHFVYPKRVGYSPAHIAIFAEASHIEGAKAFANFVLSDAGQKLLFHPDIRKLPVRPSAYVAKPEGYFDPFAAAELSPPSDEIIPGPARQELVSALFDAMITRPHDALRTMWSAIDEAERAQPENPQVLKARALAEQLPVSLAQANDADMQRLFNQRNKDADADAKARALEQQWDAQIAANYAQATKLAQDIVAQAKR